MSQLTLLLEFIFVIFFSLCIGVWCRPQGHTGNLLNQQNLLHGRDPQPDADNALQIADRVRSRLHQDGGGDGSPSLQNKQPMPGLMAPKEKDNDGVQLNPKNTAADNAVAPASAKKIPSSSGVRSVAGGLPSSSDPRYPQTATFTSNMASAKNNQIATVSSGTEQMPPKTSSEDTRASGSMSSSAENEAKSDNTKTQEGVISKTRSNFDKEQGRHKNDLNNESGKKNKTKIASITGVAEEFTGSSSQPTHREGDKKKSDRINKGTSDPKENDVASQSGSNPAALRRTVNPVPLLKSSLGSNVRPSTKSRNASMPGPQKTVGNDQNLGAANQKLDSAGKAKTEILENPKNQTVTENSKSGDTTKVAQPRRQEGKGKKKDTSKPYLNNNGLLGSKTRKSNQGLGEDNEKKESGIGGMNKENLLKEKDRKGKTKEDGERNQGKKGKILEEGKKNKDDEDKNGDKFQDRGSTNKQGKDMKKQGDKKQLTGTREKTKDEKEKEKLKRKNDQPGVSKQVKDDEDNDDEDVEDKVAPKPRRKPTTTRSSAKPLERSGIIGVKNLKEGFLSSDLDQDDLNAKKPKTRGWKKTGELTRGLTFEKKPWQRRSNHFSRGGAETDGVSGSSHFIVYGTVGLILLIVLYIVYQKRQKILALIVEGRRRGASGSGERSRRGSGNIAYRPLPTKETDDAAARPESLQKYIY